MTENPNASRYTWTAPIAKAELNKDTFFDPSYEPVRLGFIGVGNMGSHTLKQRLNDSRVRITALCDCDSSHLEQAMAMLKDAGIDGGVKCFSDFRELNRSSETEAVVISTPDHWHALIGIDAMKNGKDVYIEKPLTLTVAEGRWLSDTETETGLICQTGTQQRSSAEFRRAVELMRNRCLGDVKNIEVCLPYPNVECEPSWEPMNVPEELDYDMWIGPAEMKPYHEQRCHYSFRFISDYSGGQMTNWGAHHLDIVQWALGMDTSGPVKVSGKGTFPESGLFDVAKDFDVTWEYEDGTVVKTVMGGPLGVTFIGEKGTLSVGRRRIECDTEGLLDTELPEDAECVYVSDDHMGNFLTCIRTRRSPICTMETGHRSATVCHLGNIAMKLGRPLSWDPDNECFDGDDEADEMLSRPVRSPWDELLG